MKKTLGSVIAFFHLSLAGGHHSPYGIPDGFELLPEPVAPLIHGNDVGKQQATPRFKVQTEHTLNIGIDKETAAIVIGGVIVVYTCFAVYNALGRVFCHLNDNHDTHLDQFEETIHKVDRLSNMIKKTATLQKDNNFVDKKDKESLAQIQKNFEKRRSGMLEDLQKKTS